VPSGPCSAATMPVLPARNRGSAGHGVVAQPGELVEQERRPDGHRRAAREVVRPHAVDVLRTRHRVVGDQLPVEVERRHALRAVHRDLAGLVDHLAAVGQREVLERLLGERVARRRGADEADPPLRVQGARRVHDRVVGGGRGQARRVEQVAAVVQQLRPRLARHRELAVAVARELQGGLVPGVRAERVDHRLVGVGVRQVVDREGVHRRQRDRTDHVGEVTGRGRRGQRLVELVLLHPDELDLDPGLLGEPVDDRLGGGHAVGQGVGGPHGDRVALAVTVAAPAAGGDRHDGHEPDGDSDTAGHGSHHLSLRQQRRCA